MSNAALMISKMTVAEYLAFEATASEKYEYFQGEIFAMAGAGRRQNLAALNIAAELRQRLASKPCETYVSDLRVHLQTLDAYYYPDVVVACAPQFTTSKPEALLNPLLIVEVLSESTERFDRGVKFSHYRSWPSLQIYLLVSVDRLLVEVFQRQGEHWLFTDYQNLSDEIPLSLLDVQLSLPSIYARISFSE